jgi:hypothetical protein
MLRSTSENLVGKLSTMNLNEAYLEIMKAKNKERSDKGKAQLQKVAEEIHNLPFDSVDHKVSDHSDVLNALRRGSNARKGGKKTRRVMKKGNKSRRRRTRRSTRRRR